MLNCKVCICRVVENTTIFYESFSSVGSPTLIPNVFFLSPPFSFFLLAFLCSLTLRLYFFPCLSSFLFFITVAILVKMYCYLILFSFPCILSVFPYSHMLIGYLDRLFCEVPFQVQPYFFYSILFFSYR